MSASDAILDRHARLAVGLDIQPADHFAERLAGLGPWVVDSDASFMERTRQLRGLVGVR